MKLAVISDIHGNRLALEAVEADIAHVGVDATVNLGDLLSGPLDPLGTLDRLRERNYPTIRGNHDRWLVERTPDSMDKVDRFVANQLDAERRDWLHALPATLVIDGDIFLCHGTPTSDTRPWLDNWWRGRDSTSPGEAAVTAEAEGLDHPVILCGHTHIARMVRLRDGRLVVNPGAVGLQINHGSPDARYAVVERRGGVWSASLRAVPYDSAGAAAQAAANAFDSWCEALTSGWAGPEGLFQ